MIAPQNYDAVTPVKTAGAVKISAPPRRLYLRV
jgi:hypothetical protein